ncbi:acylamino-acid-releasing enzyme-like isoform X2 [Pieris brassicae]|uniref:acylamino-acid-releasing enzyme-like isoform X2 n=1 Tax=Pieris brassicae TaxID=7116 RepID=UPI001E66254D|nr:acylamino-acid-releasing enzyme-like isoform X2 [Pieris brassicae]
MTGQIERIVQVYKTLSKIPSILGARLNNSGTKVSTKWSVRNIDKGKNSQFAVNYILDEDLKVVAESDFGINISNELLSAVSPKETYKAIIREEKNGKDNKCFLEVWSKNCLAHSIDLTALDVHGNVYADAEFGCLDWSPDEKSLIYIAEQKPKKSEPYIKRKPADKEAYGGGDKTIIPGEEYIYKPDWGEQLVGKKRSVIVKCDLDTETLSLLDGIPEAMCPGQVKFTADGRAVVGVVWQVFDPSRLGLIFCTNRLSHIFYLSLDGVYRRLSRPEGAVRSPRLSPEGDVVWLQRTLGGPHHACHQIVRLTKNDLDSVIAEQINESKEEILLDIVEDKMYIKNGTFHGMYGPSLPLKCWSRGRLIFSTPCLNEVNSYVLDLESKIITNISLVPAGSTSVLCVVGDKVLASYSNVKTPGQLYIAKIPERGSEMSIQWVRVSTPNPVPELSDAQVEYLNLEHPNCEDDVKSFNCILVSSSEKRPLVVWPHGGPHSAFVNAYSLETAFFHLLGLATLRLNYRGSTGSGDDNVISLIGHVGVYDVQDALLALNILKGNFEKFILYGGSYGGFLCAHLAGLYPDMFKAMVLRNPLIDLATKVSYADNPDGCYVEAGLNYHESGEVLDKEILAMRRCSPIVHAHKVKAPTALMLGSNDKRVPCYQGLDYAKRLKANGVDTRVYMYEDNHSLSSLNAEMDNLINGADWFLTHLNE